MIFSFSNYDKLMNIDDIEPSEWTEPFYFIHAADPQFGLINKWEGLKKRNSGESIESWTPKWYKEMELSEKLIANCNKMDPKPKFMVISGDMVDEMPENDHELRGKQIDDFKRIFSKLSPDIPLLYVSGNHDVRDIPTMPAIEAYHDEWGDDYYHFSLNGVLFIVINSQFYTNRQHVEEYAREQDEWLESVLDRCKQFKYSIVFNHLPWFWKNYMNITEPVRLGWLGKFKEAGVNKIMCGHCHRNAGGWYENIELVVTSAIGQQMGADQSGVRIVKVRENSIEHQYYSIDQIPTTVEI